MVIDYSQTVNKYISVDAYPLPRIDTLVQKVANYSVFSTLDLRSAYHQIPIMETERSYTAFEACGRLYQFKRIPFGVTNGVSAFQRVMDSMITSENLEGTFAYLDDVTVCGKDKKEHDVNLRKLLDCAKRYNLTFNDDKCSFAQKSIKLLGYLIPIVYNH